MQPRTYKYTSVHATTKSGMFVRCTVQYLVWRCYACALGRLPTRVELNPETFTLRLSTRVEIFNTGRELSTHLPSRVGFNTGRALYTGPTRVEML